MSDTVKLQDYREAAARAQDAGGGKHPAHQVRAPGPGELVVVDVQPGREIDLAFDPDRVRVAWQAGALVLGFPDGGTVRLDGLADAIATPDAPRITLADGTTASAADLVAVLDPGPAGPGPSRAEAV